MPSLLTPYGPSSYSPGVFNPTLGDVSQRKGIQKGINAQQGILAGQQATAAGKMGGEYKPLFGGYSSLLDSGYSPLEKSAIKQSTLGAISGAYGTAADAANRRLARTGNAAGYGSFLGKLARSKGRDMAAQNLQNQKDFADETLRRKLIGLQGIAGLYGIDTSFLNSLNALQNQALGLGVNTYGISSGKKSFGELLGGAFATSLGSGLGSFLTH